MAKGKSLRLGLGVDSRKEISWTQEMALGELSKGGRVADPEVLGGGTHDLKILTSQSPSSSCLRTQDSGNEFLQS